MNKLLLLWIVAFWGFKLYAQPKSVVQPIAPAPADWAKLKRNEDTLRMLSQIFLNDTVLQNRKSANYRFIPILKRSLQIPGSFGYRFDSLDAVSILYPSDSSFRIFTWQAGVLGNRVRYYGILQMKSKEFKAFPLIDHSDTMEFRPQQIMVPDRWYGALYYHIDQHEIKGKKVYTLFGFEAYEPLSRRKLLDVLTFDEKGNPRFGYPLFVFKNDSTSYKEYDTLNRFFLDYSYKTTASMNVQPEMGMIVFDHLEPPSEKAKDAYFSYIPDGTYEGFIWKDMAWRHVKKIQNYDIGENDNPPVPNPVFGRPDKQPVLPGETMPAVNETPTDTLRTKPFSPPKPQPPGYGTNPFPAKPR